MDVISAIADPVRREIMLQLRRGPMTAGAIASMFDISRPAISRHLRVLRDAGLVVATSGGSDRRERVYRLDVAPLAEVDRWLATMRRDWHATLDALETEVHRTSKERRDRETHIRSLSEKRSSA